MAAFFDVFAVECDTQGGRKEMFVSFDTLFLRKQNADTLFLRKQNADTLFLPKQNDDTLFLPKQRADTLFLPKQNAFSRQPCGSAE